MGKGDTFNSNLSPYFTSTLCLNVVETECRAARILNSPDTLNCSHIDLTLDCIQFVQSNRQWMVCSNKRSIRRNTSVAHGVRSGTFNVYIIIIHFYFPSMNLTSAHIFLSSTSLPAAIKASEHKSKIQLLATSLRGLIACWTTTNICASEYGFVSARSIWRKINFRNRCRAAAAAAAQLIHPYHRILNDFRD